MSQNQFSLLKETRFKALFITQFTSAFHDNLFKNALVVLILFNVGSFTVTNTSLLVTFAAALFIFPFLIFSALGASLADIFDKPTIIRGVKLAEIVIALIGGISLLTENLILSFITLFLLGAHSAIFSPNKYSILPELLTEEELISGNALLNTGTFLSILLGTLGGTTLPSIPKIGIFLVFLLIFVSTISGYISSRKIPSLAKPETTAKFSFNFIKKTKDTFLFLLNQPYTILFPVLGISWFYFMGAMFLSQIPNYTKEILGAGSGVLTFFLVLFSIGIAFGGLLNNSLLKGRIEATYVPLAAFGITLFSIDLYFASHFTFVDFKDLQTLLEFVKIVSNWRIVFDLVMIAIMCGFFVVPLLAIVQYRSLKESRTYVIAGSAIMDSLFIVASSAIAAVLILIGLDIKELFLVFAIANFFVALLICILIPDVLFKAILQIIFKFLYKVEIKGLENVEKAGERAVIIANHSSLLDGPLLAAFLPGRPMFVIHTEIAESTFLKPFLKLVETFPVDPTNPFALKTLIAKVHENRHVVIFPEGRLTVTGSLMKVYEGPGVVAEKTDAMILPVRIDGTQHTSFARLKGKISSLWFPKITLTFLPPRKFIVPESIHGRERRHIIGQAIYDLMEEMLFITEDLNHTLFNYLLDTVKQNGKNVDIIEDVERTPLNYKNLLRRSLLLGRKIASQTNLGENVGVLLPNGSGLVSFFFALQAIGRVPAMINFTSGLSSINETCKMSNINTIYTSKRFIEKAQLEEIVTHLETRFNLIYLEDLRSTLRLWDKFLALITSPRLFHKRFNVSSESPAVVLFTSGSEGTPKGVVLSHKNLICNIVQLSCRVDFNRQDIIFNALPLFHSFGLTGGFLLPLLRSVKTFLYPSPLHYRIIPELIYFSNATIMFGTDTFLRGYARMAHSYDFHQMRYIFAGAEKVKDETRHLYMERFGVRILEGYGTTETAPVLSVNSAHHITAGSVGRFLKGIEHRIEPVEGVEDGGRLFVKGNNVMLGYYLVDKPGEIQGPEEGWHDTGDIVRIDAEGFIYIVGRAKRFAKIAGEMVYLGAIEEIVRSVFTNEDHAILSIPDSHKGEKIVLVTTKKDFDQTQLISYIKSKGLSQLNVPTKIIIIEKMPILSTGKTDYVALASYVLEKNFDLNSAT